MIPRKQQSSEADWTGFVREAYENPNTALADELVGKAAAAIKRRARLAKHAAFGWSGGKDSQGLRIVAEAAGIRDSVLAISRLEYPAFLAWATDNMPWGLTIETRPLDLDWLRRNPAMLFPQNSTLAAKWFSLLQHAGQRAYVKEHNVDLLLLGRRRSDGNFVGRNGEDEYRDKAGFVRYSPLAHWTHEDLLTVLGAHKAPLPPCYDWPRGFRVGTGPWPARQWCPSIAAGWAEVAAIDAGIVETAAAAGIPGAEDFLCAD